MFLQVSEVMLMTVVQVRHRHCVMMHAPRLAAEQQNFCDRLKKRSILHPKLYSQTTECVGKSGFFFYI